MLDAVGVPYSINERMVRGLDYYTRTTFEFTHGGLGAQSAVLAAADTMVCPNRLRGRRRRASASRLAKIV